MLILLHALFFSLSGLVVLVGWVLGFVITLLCILPPPGPVVLVPCSFHWICLFLPLCFSFSLIFEPCLISAHLYFPKFLSYFTGLHLAYPGREWVPCDCVLLDHLFCLVFLLRRLPLVLVACSIVWIVLVSLLSLVLSFLCFWPLPWFCAIEVSWFLILLLLAWYCFHSGFPFLLLYPCRCSLFFKSSPSENAPDDCFALGSVFLLLRQGFYYVNRVCSIWVVYCDWCVGRWGVYFAWSIILCVGEWYHLNSAVALPLWCCEVSIETTIETYQELC